MTERGDDDGRFHLDGLPRRHGHFGGRLGPGDRLEVPGHQVGVVADDLAGIQDVVRVEGVLDLAECVEEVAGLAAEELGPGQPAAMLAGDRAAEIERGFEDGGRHRLELGHVAGIAHVEERADVKLAVARVGVEGPAHLELLEDVLEPPEVLGQRTGRDGDVLHERHRPPRPPHPHQARRDRLPEGQQEVAIGPAARLDRVGNQDSQAFDPADHPSEPVEDLGRVVAIDLDDQRGFRRLGEPGAGGRQDVSGQAERSPVEKLARRGAVSKALDHGPGRVADPAERQDDHRLGRG